jgi:hypothetical protein
LEQTIFFSEAVTQASEMISGTVGSAFSANSRGRLSAVVGTVAEMFIDFF